MKAFNTIESSKNYSDSLRYNNINKNQKLTKNIIYKNKSINKKNQSQKKLAILKEGMIYWLRKLYIILPEGLRKINNNDNLYMYFYFPIKDINMKIEKKCLFKEEGTEIFCKNIENIFEKVRQFLKISNYKDYFKFTIYNEDYVLIKNDNQLM